MQKHIMNTFYGYDGDVPKKVVVTPISPVYRFLVNAMDEKMEFKGWWDAARGVSSGNECLLLRAPEGAAIVDPLNAVGCAEQILLAGYCGSLNDAYPVGSIVHPGIAWRNGKSMASVMHSDSTVSLQQVESVTGVDYRGIGEDVVDMETYSFFETAARMSHAYGSVLLVTDMPKKEGSRFYEIPHQTTISNAADLVAGLLSYLNADSMPP